jgi:hypothetical protein
MIHSMKRKVAAVRTLKQARTYILQVGICGIFSDAGVGMPNLWEVVDLPDRQPGEKGWGQKVIAIWRVSQQNLRGYLIRCAQNK